MLRRLRESSHGAPVAADAAAATPDESDHDSDSGDSATEDAPTPGATLRRSFALRRIASEPVPPLLQENPWPSLRWWVSPMLDSVRNLIEERAHRGLARSFTSLSFCTGIFAEGFGGAALGIPEDPTPCAEKGEECQSFLVECHRHRLHHLFTSMEGFCTESGVARGPCYHHGKMCVEDVGGRDCAIGGSPCQPFSKQRAGRWTRDEALHPLYQVTFGEIGCEGGSILAALEMQQPLGGIIEQVVGFSACRKGQLLSPLDTLMRAVARIQKPGGGQLYTAMKVFKMDSNEWLDIARPRPPCVCTLTYPPHTQARKPT